MSLLYCREKGFKKRFPKLSTYLSSMNPYYFLMVNFKHQLFNVTIIKSADLLSQADWISATAASRCSGPGSLNTGTFSTRSGGPCLQLIPAKSANLSDSVQKIVEILFTVQGNFIIWKISLQATMHAEDLSWLNSQHF